MMRARLASGFKGKLSRTWLGGKVGVGEELRLAAEKLPLEPFEYAQSSVAEARMLSARSDGSRGFVAVSVCSTWARCPARVALYYY